MCEAQRKTEAHLVILLIAGNDLVFYYAGHHVRNVFILFTDMNVDIQTIQVF